MSTKTEDVPDKHDPLAAMRQRSFQLYASSRVAAGIAQSLLQAVLAWQVYDISGSALSLGLLGLVRFFPALGASLIGGLVADTYDRRKTMMLAQLVPLSCVAILCAATLGGWVTLAMIYALVLFIGLASAFEAPARTALLPAIVLPETFANAVTVNNVLQRLGAVSGPALAGGIIAVIGVGSAYAFYCVALAASFLPLLFIRMARPFGTRQKFSLSSVLEGIDYVRRRQVILGAMSLDMFAVIFGGANALLPIYATDILKAGPEGFGILLASMQVGSFAMSVVLLVRPPIKRTGRALVHTVALYAIATIAFGLSRDFALSVFFFGLTGAFDQISVVMRQTTIQMTTPDELRGRVSSVHQVFVQASGQIGAVESGFVAALTTATFSVVSGGVIALGIAGLIGRCMPALYNYEIGQPPDRQPVSKRDTKDLEELPTAAGGS